MRQSMEPPDYKKFFCRFLQDHGVCRFSDTCKFSHVAQGAYKVPENVCIFFLKGKCRKSEEQCSFLHISADGLIEQLRAISIYSGDRNLLANEPSTSRPSTSRPSTSREPTRVLRDRASGDHPRNRKKDYDVKPKPREEILCGICLEDVVGRSFGLLTNCNHSFCYDCLVSWRKQSNSADESATKSCPECRKPSEMVVPSRRFVVDADRIRVIEAYKDRRKNTICKYERDGQNYCRYKDSCMFKHTLPFRRLPPPTRTTTARSLQNSNLILNTIFADANEFEFHIYYSD